MADPDAQVAGEGAGALGYRGGLSLPRPAYPAAILVAVAARTAFLPD